jgi:hypothetical protein
MPVTISEVEVVSASPTSSQGAPPARGGEQTRPREADPEQRQRLVERRARRVRAYCHV